MAIINKKIKELEKEFGTFQNYYSGWMVFKEGVVSANGNIKIKTTYAKYNILSHQFGEESQDNKTPMWKVGLN